MLSASEKLFTESARYYEERLNSGYKEEKHKPGIEKN